MKPLLKIINKLSPILLGTSILIGLQSQAQAMTFSGRAAGEWGLPDTTSNPNAVVSITSENGGTNNRLTWGVPGTEGFSNYVQFNGAEFNTTTDNIFSLGVLDYRNGSTILDTNFDGDFPLSLGLSLTIPLTSAEDFEFLFNIYNTPNTTGNPVLDGDILRFSTAGLTSQTFNHDGIDYTLQLVGFSTNGGQTIVSEFKSPEMSVARASLYGKITAAPPITSLPEPTTLVSLALISVYLATRRPK